MAINHEVNDNPRSAFRSRLRRQNKEAQHPVMRTVAAMGGLMLLDQMTTQLGFSLAHANSFTAEASPIGEFFFGAGGGSAVSMQAFALTGLKLAAVGGLYTGFKIAANSWKKDDDKVVRGVGKFLNGTTNLFGGGVILGAGLANINNLYHAGGYTGLWPVEAPWDPAINYYLHNYHLADWFFQLLLDHH